MMVAASITTKTQSISEIGWISPIENGGGTPSAARNGRSLPPGMTSTFSSGARTCANAKAAPTAIASNNQKKRRGIM